jgi:ABC-type uncharacterized transport system permease subunit
MQPIYIVYLCISYTINMIGNEEVEGTIFSVLNWLILKKLLLLREQLID